MNVEEHMTKSVECCGPGDSLELAAQLMWSRDCGCLPVCDSTLDRGRRTIGVITDRDICMCALFQHKALSELRVGDAMAKRVISCRMTDPLQLAERLMRSRRIRRLPVLDDEGALAGMISLADLARVAAYENHNGTANVPESEVGHTLAAICASF